MLNVKRGTQDRENVGGLATGLFNPETKEFSLSWDRVFDGGTYEREDLDEPWDRRIAISAGQVSPQPLSEVVPGQGLLARET